MPKVALIAHRGGAAEGYENTLEAYHHAVRLGAGMLELDVHLTKDGEVVVAHDQHLLRLTGVDRNIRDLNFSQMPTIKDTLNIDFRPGEYYCDKSVMPERRVFARFEDVLKTFPDTQINIDVKVGDRGLVEAVNKIIVDNDAETRCVWGSFSRETTERCHLTNPNIGLIFSMARVLRLYLTFYLGLLSFIPIKETHLELPLPSIFFDDKFRSDEGNVGIAKMAVGVLRIIDWFLMSPVLFDHLDRRGILVYLWVLNDEKHFERAFSLGAHGVMTDYPSKLRTYLERKDK